MAPPFRTQQIGSLIRPLSIRPSSRWDTNSDPSKTNHVVTSEDVFAAIKQTLAIQLSLDYHPLSNGEYNRTTFINGIFESLAGLTKLPLAIPDDFRTNYPTVTLFGPMGLKAIPATIATGKVEFKQSAYLDEFEMTKRALRELADGDESKAAKWISDVKITIPTLTWYYSWAKEGKVWTPESGYPDAKSYLADMATAFKKEIQTLYDAGLRHLQIDDPNLSFLVVENFRKGLQQDGIDPEDFFEVNIWAHNQLLQGLPEDLDFGMHMCKGNFPGGLHCASGGYEWMAKRLFNETNYRTFYLEYENERSGTLAPLRFLPRGKNVVLGVVSTKFAQLEDLGELETKVRDAARIIANAQGRTEEEVLQDSLAVSPQCGFASSSDGTGKDMTEEDQWKKLRLLKELTLKLWPEKSNK